MVPNPFPELTSPEPKTVSGDVAYSRIRFRFEKNGPLRWLSHHDLIRAVDRLCRRLELPVIQSQGFHPQPALVFALSLPMGAVGFHEILEIDFSGLDWDPLDLLDRLNGQSPPGLRFLAATQVGPKVRAQVHSLEYRVSLPEGLQKDIVPKIESILGSPKLLVDRGKTPTQNTALEANEDTLGVKDLRDSLGSLHWAPPFLVMGLFPKPQGTIKPTELLARLGWPIDSEEFSYPLLERSRLTLVDDQFT